MLLQGNINTFCIALILNALEKHQENKPIGQNRNLLFSCLLFGCLVDSIRITCGTANQTTKQQNNKTTKLPTLFSDY